MLLYLCMYLFVFSMSSYGVCNLTFVSKFGEKKYMCMQDSMVDAEREAAKKKNGLVEPTHVPEEVDEMKEGEEEEAFEEDATVTLE